MPGARSRHGCEECRRRRRKCDEQKPSCGSCVEFNRKCSFKLKIVWGGRKFDKSCFGNCLDFAEASPAERLESGDGGFIYSTRKTVSASKEPLMPPLAIRSLPNGVSLPPIYQRLLRYFTEDVLASLSCHPEIHEDFRKGLIPPALQSPQLLSACLALSAAGLNSRGFDEMEGIKVSSIFEHLQSSGLLLLRNALCAGVTTDILLATCHIWCLTDVFAYRRGLTSWKVHLQGIKAMLGSEEAIDPLKAGSHATRLAMRHLHQLYLSLETLPVVPLTTATTDRKVTDIAMISTDGLTNHKSSIIDGFLGYSRDLLTILQEVDLLAAHDNHNQQQADMLLGRLKGMICRDTNTPPTIALSSSLSPEYGREFNLCHGIFQQATLIQIYRRLYRLPSSSTLIRDAVRAIENMSGGMSQGEPCHAWVAMAMPIFTIGCEAFTENQKSFVKNMLGKLDLCIGSLHVSAIKQALFEVWTRREAHGDLEGRLCAHQVLGELEYNIILF